MLRVGTPTPPTTITGSIVTFMPRASAVSIGLFLGLVIMIRSTLTCIGTTMIRSLMALASMLTGAGAVTITRGAAHGDTICGVGTHGDRVLAWDGAINPTPMEAGDMTKDIGMAIGTHMTRTEVSIGVIEADLINRRVTLV
jgi:hypothetical protein